MDKKVKVWYDKEADFPEVLFEKKEGYFQESDNDAVMEKVDTQGNVIGISILKVSETSKKPLSIDLEKVA